MDRWVRVVACAVATVAASCATMTAQQEARRPSVEQLRPEWIDVRGSRQAVLFRLRADDAPTLVWMHGGPGSTLMPWTEAFDAPLLARWSIVHWDQRCAGLSFDPAHCQGELDTREMIDDAIAVVRLAKSRIGRRRLVLVGHSWGTVLALAVAVRAPELIDRLVLVGTLADYARADALKVSFIRAHETDSDPELDSLGIEPPATMRAALALSQRLLRLGALFGPMPLERLEELRRGTHLYSPSDWEHQRAGALFSVERLIPELARYRAIDAAPRIEVPVTFVHGALDMATPTTVARAYYEALAAPRGKRWHEVPGHAHFVMQENPELFARTLDGALAE